MIVRLVCVLASNSCIGTEPAASVTENVESENTDFRAVVVWCARSEEVEGICALP